MHKGIAIKSKIILLGIVLVLGVVLAGASIQPVMAANCNGTTTFFNWGCTGRGGSTIENVLYTAMDWMAVGVVIVVIGGIIYGASLYTSSGGNPAQTKKAIGIIRSAIIALVLYFAMYAILQFILPSGAP